MSPPGPIDFFLGSLEGGEPGDGEPERAETEADDAGGRSEVGECEDAATALEALERESVTAREGLERERKEVIGRQGLLTGWLVAFGVGPAALIAIVILILSGGGELIVPFFLLGTGIQLYRLAKTNRRLKKIDAELEDPIDGS